MFQEDYQQTIEWLLRSMPELERDLSQAADETQRRSLSRSLRAREKRFERLISYRFRLHLRQICQQAGVEGEFI